MMDRLLAIAMREVSMVRRLFMLIRLIALRGFLMMVRGLFMMLRGFLVMVCCLFRPGPLPRSCSLQDAEKTACGLVTIAQLEHIIWQTAGRCPCAPTQPEDGCPSKCSSVGDLKQQYGRFTSDDLQQIEGSFDKILDMLQERYGGNCVRLVRERYCKKKEELLQWADH